MKVIDAENIPMVYGGLDETPLFHSDDEIAVRAYVENVINQGVSPVDSCPKRPMTRHPDGMKDSHTPMLTCHWANDC